MSRDFVEEAIRTELLSGFDSEVAPEVAERHAETYGEQIAVRYDGPAVQAFAGPAAGADALNSSEFRVESDTYHEDLEFSLDVVDKPFDIDRALGEDGELNLAIIADAYSGMDDFDPEKQGTRTLYLSPEVEEPDEEFEDRWYALNDSLEDVLDPRLHQSKGYDHVYAFPLRETQS